MRAGGVNLYVAPEHGERRLNTRFARPWNVVSSQVHPRGRKKTVITCLR